MDRPNRRRLLEVLAGAGALAGCSSLTGDGEPSTIPPRTSTTDPIRSTSTDPPTTPPTTATQDQTTEDPSTTDQSTTATTTTTPDATPPTDMAEFRAALDDALAIVDNRITSGPYDPTWDSLAGYTVPEWFRDRKFGIYFHWGLYSVPAYRYEWYPKWMYTPNRDGWGSSVYYHHVSTYGSPAEYPYHRFESGFNAAFFDADRWADLFDRANAGFAGPVVEHHDGWSNWASGINPYNAASQGPQRDLVGELERAIRDRGMKFVTTFHHGRIARPDRRLPGDSNYLDGYYGGAYEHFPQVTEGFPNRIMYKNVEDEERWDMWVGKLVEVLERYEPDLVWHDSLHVPPEPVRRRYLAYNLNRASAQDRDVAITYKEVEFRTVVGSETLTLDYENDIADAIQPRPWLSDINIANGAWCYTTQQDYRTVRELVEILVEIVAKNGQLLLNVTPKADGSFPAAVVDRLEGLGAWLDVNGEAIFSTRPWRTWNENATVRYTQSKDGAVLYAIAEGYPDGDLYLREVPTAGSRDTTVRLLGHGEIDHRIEVGDLILEVPDLGVAERPSHHAVSFALEGFL